MTLLSSEQNGSNPLPRAPRVLQLGVAHLQTTSCGLSDRKPHKKTTSISQHEAQFCFVVCSFCWICICTYVSVVITCFPFFSCTHKESTLITDDCYANLPCQQCAAKDYCTYCVTSSWSSGGFCTWYGVCVHRLKTPLLISLCSVVRAHNQLITSITVLLLLLLLLLPLLTLHLPVRKCLCQIDNMPLLLSCS